MELLFIRVCLHLFFFYMVPLAGRTLKGLENTRGKACIFNQLLSQFALNFTFLKFHLVLHYIRITFFMNTFLFLCHVPQAGRILDGLENTTEKKNFAHLR